MNEITNEIPQSVIPALNYDKLSKTDWAMCPKYNWIKMDPWERISANVLEAVGSKEAVVGGVFGIVIFAIILFFFRKQAVETIFGKKETK